MSYILDALKKSEAERNRGIAPSLLASRHVHLGSRFGIWVLLAALVVNVLLGGAWLFWRSDVAAPEAEIAAAPPITPRPESVVSDQPPAAAPKTTSVPEPIAQTPFPSSPISTNSNFDAEPLVATAALPTTKEMELANLTFSTHVYADDPTLRAVTLNGRRLVEGDTIGAGVQLKQITESGVVLEVNGRDVPLEVLQDWR